jgi:hypothetical protein
MRASIVRSPSSDGNAPGAFGAKGSPFIPFTNVLWLFSVRYFCPLRALSPPSPLRSWAENVDDPVPRDSS